MKEKKLLEKKDWNYYVYQAEDTIELSIPIPQPTPGFDILYILSEGEKVAYLSSGIQSLDERIEDMKANFSNYKMNSWR